MTGRGRENRPLWHQAGGCRWLPPDIAGQSALLRHLCRMSLSHRVPGPFCVEAIINGRNCASSPTGVQKSHPDVLRPRRQQETLCLRRLRTFVVTSAKRGPQPPAPVARPCANRRRQLVRGCSAQAACPAPPCAGELRTPGFRLAGSARLSRHFLRESADQRSANQ